MCDELFAIGAPLSLAVVCCVALFASSHLLERSGTRLRHSLPPLRIFQLGLVTFIDLHREINTYNLADVARTNVAGDANIEDMLGCMRYAQEVVEGMLK